MNAVLEKIHAVGADIWETSLINLINLINLQ